jgi:hypothetical protein
VDGAIGKSPVATFRVIPYYARPKASVPVTKITGLTISEIDNLMDHDLQALPDDEEAYLSSDSGLEDPPEASVDSEDDAIAHPMASHNTRSLRKRKL